MSLWTGILDAIASLRARGEQLIAFFERPPAPAERSVAFAIAVISLAAKMAKADGRVVSSEVTAFRQVFQIDPGDEAAAARVFDLARQDVAGFEAYARKIGKMFHDRPQVLEDILEGLFHIALADATYHEEEENFLHRVAAEFGVDPTTFHCIEARLVTGREGDPWRVLGVARGAEIGEVKARWRALVRENHPDRLFARGLPKETINLANARLTAINRAWEEIEARSRGTRPVGGS